MVNLLVDIDESRAGLDRDLGGADPGLVARLMEVVRDVAADVEREHGAARVLTNLGRYQDSKHLHFHVNFGEPFEA